MVIVQVALFLLGAPPCTVVPPNTQTGARTTGEMGKVGVKATTAIPVLRVVHAAAQVDILRRRDGSSVYLAQPGPLAQPESWRAFPKRSWCCCLPPNSLLALLVHPRGEGSAFNVRPLRGKTKRDVHEAPITSSWDWELMIDNIIP